MKLSAQAFHKLKQAEHNWTVSYTDVATGKQAKFTCSNQMKRSHELMMQGNPYVRDVCFVKGVK